MPRELVEIENARTRVNPARVARRFPDSVLLADQRMLRARDPSKSPRRGLRNPASYSRGDSGSIRVSAGLLEWRREIDLAHIASRERNEDIIGERDPCSSFGCMLEKSACFVKLLSSATSRYASHRGHQKFLCRDNARDNSLGSL